MRFPAANTMMMTMATKVSASTPKLDAARGLVLPSREEMLRRDSKVYEFWNSHEQTLVDAWAEWNTVNSSSLPDLSTKTLINPKLVAAVEAAWSNPTVETEQLIKNLWTEVAPGVYTIQFLDLEQVHKLRSWFDAAAESGIPVRPPYGIVLNRRGFMTDPRSMGYLAAPDFQTFYRDLIDKYVRPLGRMLFPYSVGEKNDSETFSFSIQYQAEDVLKNGDKGIRHHTDASTITFNINLDEEKTWEGSSLIFYNGNQQYKVDWMPGMACIHRGATMHAALPIEKGTRSNMVLWTFAKDGGRGYGGFGMDESNENESNELHTPKERWVKPNSVPEVSPWDRWSPF